MTKLLSIFIFTVITTVVIAQPERRHILNGNKEFDSKDYGNAAVEYEKALAENPESFEANFNLGNTLYEQGKYKEAVEKYKRIINADRSKEQISNVYHNLGNAMFKEKKLKESIEAYKNALRNNPRAEESRYNLIKAKRMLAQQNKQNQKNKDNKNNKDDKNKDNKDNQQNQQNQDKNKKNEQDKKRQNQDQQNQQKQQAQQQKISKEDAERILKNMLENEKHIMKKLKMQKAKSKKVKVEKDW